MTQTRHVEVLVGSRGKKAEEKRLSAFSSIVSFNLLCVKVAVWVHPGKHLSRDTAARLGDTESLQHRIALVAATSISSDVTRFDSSIPMSLFEFMVVT